MPVHSLFEGEGEEEEKSVGEFWVEKDRSVYLALGKGKKKFMLSRETGCWVSLEVQEGLLRRGHSLAFGVQ